MTSTQQQSFLDHVDDANKNGLIRYLALAMEDQNATILTQQTTTKQCQDLAMIYPNIDSKNISIWLNKINEAMGLIRKNFDNYVAQNKIESSQQINIQQFQRVRITGDDYEIHVHSVYFTKGNDGENVNSALSRPTLFFLIFVSDFDFVVDHSITNFMNDFIGHFVMTHCVDGSKQYFDTLHNMYKKYTPNSKNNFKYYTMMGMDNHQVQTKKEYALSIDDGTTHHKYRKIDFIQMAAEFSTSNFFYIDNTPAISLDFVKHRMVQKQAYKITTLQLALFILTIILSILLGYLFL